MTLVPGSPLDDLAVGAAVELVKLAVAEGWKAAVALLKKLSGRVNKTDADQEPFAVPEPVGLLDDGFTAELAAFLRAQPELLDSVVAHFASNDVGQIRVSLRDNAQAAVQGSGVQTNTFGGR